MAPHGPYPWDDLARCLWMLAEMETMVDSRLFRNGTGARRADAVGIGWDRLRAGLDLILDQLMPDLPGGASGLLVRDYKGKEADSAGDADRSRHGPAGRRTPRPRAPGAPVALWLIPIAPCRLCLVVHRSGRLGRF
jgi:hypothetical protein